MLGAWSMGSHCWLAILCLVVVGINWTPKGGINRKQYFTVSELYDYNDSRGLEGKRCMELVASTQWLYYRVSFLQWLYLFGYI